VSKFSILHVIVAAFGAYVGYVWLRDLDPSLPLVPFTLFGLSILCGYLGGKKDGYEEGLKDGEHHALEERAWYDGHAAAMDGRPRLLPTRYVGTEFDEQWFDGYDNCVRIDEMSYGFRVNQPDALNTGDL
jgi:hypothetical protein